MTGAHLWCRAVWRFSTMPAFLKMAGRLRTTVRAVNELFRTGHTREWRIVDEIDSLVVVERAR